MIPSVTSLTAHRFQAALSREQSVARLPSLIAGVVRDGHLVWSGSHGMRTGSHPTSQAPSPDMQYRIGSITKTMTAVLVMQLRDEGLLDLNDRIDRHLRGIGYGDRTIRSLLSHSSGMQSEPAGSWWERSPGRSFDELAAAIDDQQAAFAPGHTYHYTNLAFGLLGEVVARHRGGSWWDQVSQRILAPLGMTRTSYLPQAPAATGFSVHHFAGTVNEEPSEDTGVMAPAGQVWSTIDDLAKYAVFLIAGDEAVLARSTIDEMTIAQSGSLAGGMSGGYGLGLRLVNGGSGTVVGHTGSMPGFVAGLFTDRVRRTAAVALANGTSGLRGEGFPIDLLTTLEELEPTILDAWEPNHGVPDPVAEILGVWHWGNTSYAFSWVAGKLLGGVGGEVAGQVSGQVVGEVVVSQLAGGSESHRFSPREDGTFVGTTGYHHGETLRVVRNEDSTINHLVCATFIYTRAPYDPAAPIPGGPPA